MRSSAVPLPGECAEQLAGRGGPARRVDLDAATAGAGDGRAAARTTGRPDAAACPVDGRRSAATPRPSTPRRPPERSLPRARAVRTESRAPAGRDPRTASAVAAVARGTMGTALGADGAYDRPFRPAPRGSTTRRPSRIAAVALPWRQRVTSATRRGPPERGLVQREFMVPAIVVSRAAARTAARHRRRTARPCRRPRPPVQGTKAVVFCM
ncbi:hypothetical protein SAFG77S_08168 [Streptomyces afghaniensis]